MESLLLAGCASHNNKDERGINAEPTSDEEQIPSRRLRNGEDEDYEGGDSKSKYYGCEDYRDENDLEAESYDRPEFHILTIANGETRLCTDCYLLIVAIQRRVGPTPMRWKTLRQLLSNGAFRHCQLCSLVASAPTIYMVPSYVDNMFSPRPLREHQMLFVDYPKIAKPESTSNPHVMEVVGHVDAANRICEISFRFKFFERYGEVVLAVWLEPLPETEFNPMRRFGNSQPERCEGIHTNSDITWRKPLKSNISRQTFELFESWMSTCKLDHYECCSTLSGDPIDGNWLKDDLGDTDLPSRILDILGEGTDVIRLVETGSSDCKKAPYVTLSHCWGRPDDHPPRTTRANLQEHISAGIHLSSLPKTFRDAIYITRQLDIQYLWIDSLCIVQDDEADWLIESEKMGFIYEHAALTIAACDARNSSEGCFLADRGDTHVNKTAKFFMRLGQSGTIFKTCFGHVPITQNSKPYFSPLGWRGWACQEWYLSRRIVFCTEMGFLWKCREQQHNERGRFLDMRVEREWEHLMDRYSTSYLTRETDRLVALRGIANELGKTKERKGQEYHFGLWIGGEDTAIMLCWMMNSFEPVLDVKGPAGIPSWSWASVAGAKLFWRSSYQFFHPCRNLVDVRVGKNNDGVTASRTNFTTLNIQGGKLLRIRVRPLAVAQLESQPSLMDDNVWSPEALFITPRRIVNPQMPIYSILPEDALDKEADRTRALGLAAFDRDIEFDEPGLSSREMYVVPMVESPRFAFDPFLPEGGGMHWHGEDISEKILFGDYDNAEHDGSCRFYPAWELKDQEAPRRYHMLARAGEGTFKPIGDYTSSPSEEIAQRGQVRPEARYTYDGRGTSIFWSMIVEPVCDKTGGKHGSYRRVGMALIGNEKWLEAAQQQDIAIV